MHGLSVAAEAPPQTTASPTDVRCLLTINSSDTTTATTYFCPAGFETGTSLAQMRGLSAAAEAPPQTTLWQLPNNITFQDSALPRHPHADATSTNTLCSEGGGSEGSDEGGDEGGANGGISTAVAEEATAEMKAARMAASTAACTEEQR